MYPELKVFLIAMTPIGELRASIPLGLGVYKINAFSTYFISVIGNLVPVALIMLLLDSVSGWLSTHSVLFKKFFNWFFEKTKNKYKNKIEKYGPWALVGFVAIPLPLTGAWTGAVVAFLFGICFKKAFSYIGLGILMAGLIVLGVSLGGIKIEKYLGTQTLLGILLFIGIIWWMMRRKRKRLI